MGVFSIFSSKGSFNPDSFEKVLTSITENINTNKQQIVRLQQRQKSLRRSATRYLILIYVFMVSYFYLTTQSNRAGKNRVAWFVSNQSSKRLLILIGFPLLAALIVKSIDIMFQFFINSKKLSLKTLQGKHKEKIEELKNITNFNKTNELIKKYGNEKQGKEQTQPHANEKQQQQLRNRNNNTASTRQQVRNELNLPQQQQQQQQPIPRNSNVPQAMQPQLASRPNSPSIPQQPVARTFQDRILDILIGSDNSEAVENRYALICCHCFAHNGLAPPNTEDPSEIKFQCWKCGAMNGKGTLFDQAQLELQSQPDSSPEDAPSTTVGDIKPETTGANPQQEETSDAVKEEPAETKKEDP